MASTIGHEPPPDPDRQLSLDDVELTHARTSDPPTSAAAARSLGRRTLARQNAAVLIALFDHPNGAICETVASRVGNLPNRVSRRLTDLRTGGLVELTGGTERASTGRDQIVHRLTPVGRMWAGQLAAEATRRSA